MIGAGFCLNRNALILIFLIATQLNIEKRPIESNGLRLYLNKVISK